MTQDQTGARLDALIRELSEREPTGDPVLTASFDLRTGPDGRPSAARILRQGRREGFATIDESRRETKRWVEAQIAAVEAAIEEGTADGAQGLFYLSGNGGTAPLLLETPLPLRNSVRAGDRPWMFELVRYHALYGRPVVLIVTDLHTMHARRIRSGLETGEREVDGSAHALTNRGQRTSMDRTAGAGVSGGPRGQGIAGGHSKSRVERNIQERRLNWAADAAEEIARFLEPDDLLMVAGVDEARAQLLNRLPDAARRGVVELPSLDPLPEERALAELAASEAARASLSEAAQAVDDWATGALGERGIAGFDLLRPWFERGRLGRLVVHQEAVPHLGDDEDARAHEPQVDYGRVDQAIRQALALSAEVAVTDDDRLLPHDGLLGIARW